MVWGRRGYTRKLAETIWYTWVSESTDGIGLQGLQHLTGEAGTTVNALTRFRHRVGGFGAPQKPYDRSAAT